MKVNRFNINNRYYQSGQVLLISLLVLTVALTIGLSVAVRTITTTRMTSEEDSSRRAFSAAEAGIEQALTASEGTTITGSLSNSSSYSTSKSLLLGDEILLDNGAFILKDNPVDVWLSSYPSYASPWTGSFEIYWGKLTDVCNQSESNNSMSALEVILISGSTAAPTIDHFAYDPCAARRGMNNLTSVLPGGIVAGRTFAYRTTIPVSSGLIARIIPLYAGAYIGVRGAGLPSQGVVITSVGSSGGTQHKLVSFRGYPRPPIEVYPFLIFSSK